MRAFLLRLDESEHALLLGMHHIVSDGWSMGIFVRELGALYSAFVGGAATLLPMLPVQYADFAAWQRQWLSGTVMEERLAWWTGQLAGAPEVVDLPLDRPRPAVQSYQGARASLLIGRDQAAELDAAARRLGVTPFMILLAGFATLLVRYGSQDDLVMGTPIANRGRAELEDVIGFFANTLALRVDLSGNPGFDELARRVREMALEAFTHQDIPFERLVSELKLERNLSHAPVFQAMFALQNLPPAALDLAGLTLTPMEFEAGRTQFDLSLFAVPLRSGEMLAQLVYSVALFDAGTAERLLSHFRNLLAGIAAEPGRRLSELPLLTPDERSELLAAGNRTCTEVPSLLVHQLFEASAAERPGAIAVAHRGETVTYGELNGRANRLAHYLRRLGVSPESRVAVCLERSPALVSTLLAVHKAGGAYVPLDPTYPANRIAWVLEDSRASVLITESDLAEGLPSHGARVVVLDRLDLTTESTADLAPLASAENLAYVIYTSGSTGRPKGVAVRHRGVVNFLASMARCPGIGPEDVLLAVTTIAFDIAVLELFLPLSRGARVDLVEREAVADGIQLLERLAESGATIMQATPATWRLLLEAGWTGQSRPQGALRRRSPAAGPCPRPAGPDRRAVERVRPDRDHGLVRGPPRRTGRRGRLARSASGRGHRQYRDLSARPRRAGRRAGAPGRAGRAPHRRRRARSRLLGPSRPHRRALRSGLLFRPSRRPPLSHRRSRSAAPRERKPRIPRPGRPSGQDPRLPR